MQRSERTVRSKSFNTLLGTVLVAVGLTLVALHALAPLSLEFYRAGIPREQSTPPEIPLLRAQPAAAVDVQQPPAVTETQEEPITPAVPLIALEPERPVEESAATRGVPALPAPSGAQRLVIPRIGIDSAVIDVALTGREWPVPKFVVGRLAESAKPGEVGNAVFAGHLTSLSSGNVFARLKELRVGDEVAFFGANGDRLFKVIETKLVRNTDVSVLAARPGKAIVTLITCEGRWLPHENDYDQRRVVVAELVTS